MCFKTLQLQVSKPRVLTPRVSSPQSAQLAYFLTKHH